MKQKKDWSKPKINNELQIDKTLGIKNTGPDGGSLS
jgi:hypothetical protein